MPTKLKYAVRTSKQAPSEEIGWPSKRVGWQALSLLSIAALTSYLDRVVINLLVEPVKAAFGLSDASFAALQGLAFGLFYTAMAFPLGRLSDSGNRKRIVVIGLGVFSLFAILSGFVRQYWQLFVIRTGVGVGEASLTPAAYSILSDYFPPARLARALGVFTMTAYLGIGLAYMGGGAAIGWLSVPGHLEWGIFQGRQPWQVAFMLVGAPGLALLIPLGLFLREPTRRGSTLIETPPSIANLGRMLLERRRVFVLMFAGFSLVALAGYAATTWTPALFIRVYGWTPRQIGLWYGAIYLTFGMSGAFVAGWVCDRLTARGWLDAPLKVAAFGFVGFGVFGGLAPLMADPRLALALAAPGVFLSTMPFPMAATAIQLMTPNRMRAQVTALYLTVVNLVGLGAGPLLVGLFNDHLFNQASGVRYSLAIVNVFCAPAATLLLLAAARPYRVIRTGGDKT